MNWIQSLLVGLVVTILGGIAVAFLVDGDDTKPPIVHGNESKPGKPDVAVVSIDVEGRILRKETTFSAVVENRGSAPTPDYAVGFHMSRKEGTWTHNYTPTVQGLGTVAGGGGLARLPPIPAGGRKHVKAKVFHPDPGNYKLEFFVMHPVSASGKVVEKRTTSIVIPR